MVFNRFFFKTLLRVVLLLATLVSMAMLFPRGDLLFTQLILLVVVLAQIVELVIFVNRTNYDLARFIASVKDGDFTVNFTRSEKTHSFKVLHASFNELAEVFRALETANAAQFLFLKQLVDQIEFGIIAFDERSEILLINQHAQSLLQIPPVSKWTKLQNESTLFLKNVLQFEEAKNQLIESRIAGQDRYFSVSVSAVIIQGNKYKICSFRDIKSEIQSKEIEAWHKLIRILTHEIMNSVTPLVSLTETIQMVLLDDDGVEKSVESLTEENLRDINDSLGIIKERSEGILKFVNNYRKLTRIPNPEFQPIEIGQLIQGVVLLMKNTIRQDRLCIEQDSFTTMLSVDKSLIEQVLINTIKNACEALQEIEEGNIRIYCEQHQEYFSINISDNGPGIEPEKLEKLFVPFYTTKKEGSGIGLSVSRQIMNLHGGYLEVDSLVNERTTFSLMFPKRLVIS